VSERMLIHVCVNYMPKALHELCIVMGEGGCNHTPLQRFGADRKVLRTRATSNPHEARKRKKPAPTQCPRQSCTWNPGEYQGQGGGEEEEARNPLLPLQGNSTGRQQAPNTGLTVDTDTHSLRHKDTLPDGGCVCVRVCKMWCNLIV